MWIHTMAEKINMLKRQISHFQSNSIATPCRLKFCIITHIDCHLSTVKYKTIWPFEFFCIMQYDGFFFSLSRSFFFFLIKENRANYPFSCVYCCFCNSLWLVVVWNCLLWKTWIHRRTRARALTKSPITIECSNWQHNNFNCGVHQSRLLTHNTRQVQNELNINYLLFNIDFLVD